MELYLVNKEFIIPYLETMENASPEIRAAAHNAFSKQSLDTIISRGDNGEATIKITGFLTAAGPSPLARFFGFGGTGFSEIIAAAKELEDDSTITTVKLFMDTPGGTTVFLDEAHKALLSLASKKMLIAENHGEISSAGYYLAVAATRIDAMSPLVITGSIGAVVAGLDFTDSLAREGIKQIKIISKNAPNKQPDLNTTHGQSIIQNQIDSVERVFIRVVAEGRNTNDQNVIDNFGQGDVFIASDPDPDKPDALKAGMIDRVVNSSVIDNNDVSDRNLPINAANSGANQEGNMMDLKELKADHPAVYAAVVELSVKQGFDDGVKNERKRVTAHITIGEAVDDMKLAIKCITEGTEHTVVTNANYMASQANKKAVNDRKGEGVGDLNNGKDESESESESEDELSIALANKLGVELNV